MKFSIDNTIEILGQTPDVLITLLQNASDDWVLKNEGGESWSAYDIIGHLTHGEKTDWMTRATIILSKNPDKKFEPFDRFAQFNDNKGKSMTQLLNEFSKLRAENLKQLRSKNISADQLLLKGTHPSFGEVTLAQLLATWVVHDLNHIAQISRVMAFQYKDEVGPWSAYLSILKP